jgi:hypothetical protein
MTFTYFKSLFHTFSPLHDFFLGFILCESCSSSHHMHNSSGIMEAPTLLGPLDMANPSQ